MSRMAKNSAGLLLLLCLCLPLQAQDKYIKRGKWQDGKVTDIKAGAGVISAGTTASGRSKPDATAGPSASTGAKEQGTLTYVIETENHIYEARPTQTGAKAKKINLALNGPVKFAVKRETLTLVDADKQEHKLRIVKSTIKEQHH